MPSAKIVAQKPFGKVIPPLSPGQAAPGGLARASWLNDGVAPAIGMTNVKMPVNTPARQPGCIDPSGIAVLLMVKRNMTSRSNWNTCNAERQSRRTIGGRIEKMRELPLRDPRRLADLGDGGGL